MDIAFVEEKEKIVVIYLDDLTHFGVLVLTLVKGDEVQLVAYDIEEMKWGLLQQ